MVATNYHKKTILFLSFTGVLCFSSFQFLGVSLNNDNFQTAYREPSYPIEIPQNPNLLLVYSGPTTLNTKFAKDELYLRNLEFFLFNGGVDCTAHGTIITLTSVVAEKYQPKIEEYHQKHCAMKGNKFLRIVVREDVCYDMETVKLILLEGEGGVNITEYDYFLYVNCGVTGPVIDDIGTVPTGSNPWTYEFTMNPTFEWLGCLIIVMA